MARGRFRMGSWLVPALAVLLAVGYALSRWLHPEPPVTGAGDAWAGILAAISDEGFDRPSGAWELGLPSDHGAHPNARTETWNIAMHLRDEGGEDVGAQFALLRVGVSTGAPERASPWEPRALYRGHVALLGGAEAGAVGEERFQRDLPGVVGHDAPRREVWLDDWTLRYGEGDHRNQLRLDATVGGTELGLLFTPAKVAVALDPGGGAPFRGYSITRMDVEGSIGAGADRQEVAGLAWLDHLWGDVLLPVGPIVLDRLQMQLDDGTDLSVTRTRRRDGGGTASMAGYVVDASGEVKQLAGPELEVTRTWRGDGGARYPVDWRLRAGRLRLEVAPVVDDQLHNFAVPLWSGVVTGEGVLGDRPVSGRGTLLLGGEAVR